MFSVLLLEIVQLMEQIFFPSIVTGAFFSYDPDLCVFTVSKRYRITLPVLVVQLLMQLLLYDNKFKAYSRFILKDALKKVLMG